MLQVESRYCLILLDINTFVCATAVQHWALRQKKVESIHVDVNICSIKTRPVEV